MLTYMQQEEETSDLVRFEHRSFRMNDLPENTIAEICSYLTVMNVFKLPCVWKNIEIPFAFWRDRLSQFIDLDPQDNPSRVNKKIRDFSNDNNRRFNNMLSVLVSLRFAHDEKVKSELEGNLRFLDDWFEKMDRILKDKLFEVGKISTEDGMLNPTEEYFHTAMHDLFEAWKINQKFDTRMMNFFVIVNDRVYARISVLISFSWRAVKPIANKIVRGSMLLHRGDIKFEPLKRLIKQFKVLKEHRQKRDKSVDIWLFVWSP